jgi:7,8-dihydropterin-6-yl-methyl-4-(beta-D-ribofuranosyl)aminobenzene 5'-phosphate synthase
MSNNRVRVTRITFTNETLIDTCKITVIVEDTSNKKSNLMHKHGLSLLLQTMSKQSKAKILVDTGPSQETFSNNLKTLHINLNDLNSIVLSHGHYDHTLALPEVLKLTKTPIPIVIHPKTFDPKFAYKPNLTYIGTTVKQSLIQEKNGIFLPTDTPLNISHAIQTSGEIPLRTDFETIKGFWKVDKTRFIEDSMIDEQAVIVDLGEKGLVVIVGCAHRGIINTINHSKRIMNKTKIHAIIGGFHLFNAANTVIDKTIKELQRIAPDHLYPCHCTGSKATSKIIDLFGNQCKPVHTGDTIEL